MPRRTRIAVILAATACALFCALPACLVDVDASRIGRASADAGAVSADSGRPSDSAPAQGAEGGTDGATYLGMTCGSTSCHAPFACCLLTEGKSDPKDGVCQPGDGECATSDLFRCMGPNDCAVEGTVCCVRRDPDLLAACSASCSDTILCDVAHGCPGGKSCGTSAEYPGLFTCQ